MNCCSNQSTYAIRGFLTRAEKIQMLKEYKTELEKEARGVEEKISQIESENVQ